MVICQRGTRPTTLQRELRAATGAQGGPVFWPPRKPSALVWKLLAGPELPLGLVGLNVEEGGERLAQSP